MLTNRQKSSSFVGTPAAYAAIHRWVKRNVPKPAACIECHKVTTQLDRANISQEYKREISDWEYLCRKCHMTKDGRLENLVRLLRTEDKLCKYCLTPMPKRPIHTYCSEKCKLAALASVRLVFCKNNHPLDIYAVPSANGRRMCGICRAAYLVKYNERRRKSK